MKKLRIRRGSSALLVFDMPDKDAWEHAYVQMYSTIEYRYYSKRYDILMSCEELRIATANALHSTNSIHLRAWAGDVLRHLKLPLV